MSNERRSFDLFISGPTRGNYITKREGIESKWAYHSSNYMIGQERFPCQILHVPRSTRATTLAILPGAPVRARRVGKNKYKYILGE